MTKRKQQPTGAVATDRGGRVRTDAGGRPIANGSSSSTSSSEGDSK